MQTFNCPSCGASITFQSSVSVSCVCPYCRSLVVRQDKDVIAAIGTMAELPDDMTPFQLGTTGMYKNIGFTLIGRVKVGWADGNWNEWFMLTDEGKKGWLAEAQGSLVINFEVDDALDAENDRVIREHLKQMRTVTAQVADDDPLGNYQPSDTILGLPVKLQNTAFQINDVKETVCVGSEGELPFSAPKGRKTVAIDLVGKKGEFAGIEYDAIDRARVFLGEYVEFDELKFTNLRELSGWHTPARKA